jgi:hypothetical protein
LKLPTLEAHVDFLLLKLWTTQSFSRLKVLAMEVSAKGGRWGRGQQDGRGRWVGVGRSFPKKRTWG